MSLSEGEKFIEIFIDYHLEQLVHFPTREMNTLDLIITSLPGQFLDIQSPDRLSDHDIISGTLKVVIPPIKKSRRKVYRYQKGDYESMRSDERFIEILIDHHLEQLVHFPTRERHTLDLIITSLPGHFLDIQSVIMTLFLEL